MSNIKDWTKKEASMLIRLWIKTESILMVSILMDRTPSSIQTRALRLELPSRELEDSYRRRWTKEEDDYLFSTIKKGNVDIFELSKEVKRTVDAIITRIMTKHNWKLNQIAEKLNLPDAEKIYEEGPIIGEKQARERNCARCMKPFWSESFGRRVCLSCKQTEDWQDGD